LHANGFDWDKGNRSKCEKHGLSVSTIQSLFARSLAILPDAAHSQRERRFRIDSRCAVPSFSIAWVQEGKVSGVTAGIAGTFTIRIAAGGIFSQLILHLRARLAAQRE